MQTSVATAPKVVLELDYQRGPLTRGGLVEVMGAGGAGQQMRTTLHLLMTLCINPVRWEAEVEMEMAALEEDGEEVMPQNHIIQFVKKNV